MGEYHDVDILNDTFSVKLIQSQDSNHITGLLATATLR